jgi:hypothetical protein
MSYDLYFDNVVYTRDTIVITYTLRAVSETVISKGPEIEPKVTIIHFVLPENAKRRILGRYPILQVVSVSSYFTSFALANA